MGRTTIKVGRKSWEIGTQSMTPAKWSNVETNPRQRNTEARAERAKNDHLSSFKLPQACVDMALLPDGRQFKLNGHTRSLLWDRGELDVPSILVVTVYHVKTMADVLELYECFDNQNAAEKASDRAYGAQRENDTELTSCLFTNGKNVTSVLRVLSGKPHTKIDIYGTFPSWKEELVAIDNERFPARMFSHGIISAAVATVRKHGPKALEFWRKYAEKAGERIDGRSDAVDVLVRHYEVAQASGMGGGSPQLDLCERGIACCEGYFSRRKYRQCPRGITVREYLYGEVPAESNGHHQTMLA